MLWEAENRLLLIYFLPLIANSPTAFINSPCPLTYSIPLPLSALLSVLSSLPAFSLDPFIYVFPLSKHQSNVLKIPGAGEVAQASKGIAGWTCANPNHGWICNTHANRPGVADCDRSTGEGKTGGSILLWRILGTGTVFYNSILNCSYLKNFFRLQMQSSLYAWSFCTKGWYKDSAAMQPHPQWWSPPLAGRSMQDQSSQSDSPFASGDHPTCPQHCLLYLCCL